MYFLCILLYLYLTQRVSATQTFLQQPSDVTVNEGDNITLPCKVSNRRGNVQWTRDDFGLGIDRQLSGFPRYQMVGGGEDFSLSISSVNLEEDDARFQCQVLAAEGGVAAVQSDNATVTVQVVPEDPLILHGDKIQVRQGSSVEVTCKSFRGKPAAEVIKHYYLFYFANYSINR